MTATARPPARTGRRAIANPGVRVTTPGNFLPVPRRFLPVLFRTGTACADRQFTVARVRLRLRIAARLLELAARARVLGRIVIGSVVAHVDMPMDHLAHASPIPIAPNGRDAHGNDEDQNAEHQPPGPPGFH